MISNISTANLKKVAKLCGIQKYSKMNKSELVSNVSPELSGVSVRSLREIAKLAKITGYSRKNKAQLLGLMVAATSPVSSPAPSSNRTEGLSRGQLRKKRKELRKTYGPGTTHPEIPGYMTFNKGQVKTWSHGVIAA
jgi:hypothetical protein